MGQGAQAAYQRHRLRDSHLAPYSESGLDWMRLCRMRVLLVYSSLSLALKLDS